MNKYNRQGGWVASFLIVGILLTLSVLGGLYYLKTNNKQLAGTNDTSTTETTSDTSEDSTQTTPADSGVVAQNEEKKGETIDTNGSNSSEAKLSQAPTSTTQPSSGTPSTGKLPATGPEDTLYNAVVVTLVTFALATYLRSRSSEA